MGLIDAMVYKLWSWMTTHKADANAHHTKYTDAEAVAAVLAGDDYVKTIGDEMTSGIVADWETVIPAFRHNSRTAAGGLYLVSADVYQNGAFLQFNPDQAANQPGYAKVRFGSEATALNAQYEIRYNNPGGNVNMMVMNGQAKTIDINNCIMKNIKNHAASALSGTKKLIEIDIGGVPYYIEVYPTKA